MSQKNLPPGHQWVPTEDGSHTLFSEQFQEACHSTFGAREETLLHYVNGCQIPDKIKLCDTLTILEVGFGLGIGFLTTLPFLETSANPWHFISLEIDPDLMEWFRTEHSDHDFLKYLAWIDVGPYKILQASRGQQKLTILVGNARETLPHYISSHPIKWNAIYQDAFSPKKNPILWTKQWFQFLKDHSTEDVILSTYSSSSSIRKSLLASNWKLHKGDKFGPKRTSTRATLTGESDVEILAHLDRSPILAITDDKIEEFLKGTK